MRVNVRLAESEPTTACTDPVRRLPRAVTGRRQRHRAALSLKDAAIGGRARVPSFAVQRAAPDAAGAPSIVTASVASKLLPGRARAVAVKPTTSSTGWGGGFDVR